MQKLAGETPTLEQQNSGGQLELRLQRRAEGSPKRALATSWAQGKGQCWAD